MNSAQNFLYEYAVVRFMPDIARQEFVNIGLIMMCKRQRWIKFRHHIDNQRVNCLKNVEIPTDAIARQLASFVELSKPTPDVATGMADFPVEERFRWLTAVRSACIRTSEVHPGKTRDLDGEFERLFAELVL